MDLEAKLFERPSYLLQGEEKPFCVGCDTDFTVRHILIEYPDFGETRRKYFKCTNLKTLFSVVDPSGILDFVKTIGLYGNLNYNKLQNIMPKLGPRNPSGLSRRDEVKFTRLRIGHTSLTHKYLLQGEEKPFCVGCNTDFTVRHIW